MKIRLVRYCFLFHALLFPAGISAQQQSSQADKILFRGVVIAVTGGERLAGSQIIINSKNVATSKPDGTFSFFAARRDTVLFKMLGYIPEKFIVSDTIRTKEVLAGIYLRTDTIEIGEVVILPRFPNMRAEILNTRNPQSATFENAKTNLNIASYQGRSGASDLGDPAINYEVLKQKQKIEAYEKGGIPSDRMAGINPLILIPAAYMLLHGPPEAPQAPEPRLTQKELDELNDRFMQLSKRKPSKD